MKQLISKKCEKIFSAKTKESGLVSPKKIFNDLLDIFALGFHQTEITRSSNETTKFIGITPKDDYQDLNQEV